MIPRYPHYPRRRTLDLGGFWAFCHLGDAPPNEIDLDKIDWNDRMAVPGCFDTIHRYAGKRGIAAYHRQVSDLVPGDYRIIFYHVSHWCRVFINGSLLAEQTCGFTPFTVDFTVAEEESLDLVLLVDNRFDADRIPLHPSYADWYHHGGIAGDVVLRQLPETRIDELVLDTMDYQKRRVKVKISYAAVKMDRAPLKISCRGETLLAEDVSLEKGTGFLERVIQLTGKDLWSPESPALHKISVCLADDEVVERVGIRQVDADGKRIKINGQPVRLLGYNRHHIHPESGYAFSDAALMRDVSLIRQTGANFVRGSHYPQCQRFLELCDETGLCVWNEGVAWQQDDTQLTDEKYIAAQKAHLETMVRWSRNHPCVIMWGVLNEGASHLEVCRRAYETFLGTLRAADPSRPLTYASNHPMDDKCLDLADILSVNTYPGWYSAVLSDIPAALQKIIDHLTAVAPGKPVIMSEIGAGAVYGVRDPYEQKWSEEYQVRLLDTVIRWLYADDEKACGLAIWQFCDIRTSEDKAIGRPRAFNNKGIVDEYRRPKLAFDAVKRLFTQYGDGCPAASQSDPEI